MTPINAGNGIPLFGQLFSLCLFFPNIESSPCELSNYLPLALTCFSPKILNLELIKSHSGSSEFSFPFLQSSVWLSTLEITWDECVTSLVFHLEWHELLLSKFRPLEFAHILLSYVKYTPIFAFVDWETYPHCSFNCGASQSYVCFSLYFCLLFLIHVVPTFSVAFLTLFINKRKRHLLIH